jgi:5-methylcytosine-specific restriction endonuclease McrA/DNA-binding CsgD family transcriptional regulator
LYKQGFLHKEIAEKLGCATCTITNHLLKLGIKSYNTNRKEEVLKLHQQGLYDREIAEKLHITRENVTHLLNKQGITNRKSKKDNIELKKRISDSLLGRYIGENNPNFKGYKDEKRIARGIFKTMSKRILLERNYTCEHCGKHGGDLNVHHIKPFIVILNEFISTVYTHDINNFYNEIINYKDFIDENNMVVLCRDCHKKVHYSDNHELSPYRWESATTIEKEH